MPRCFRGGAGGEELIQIALAESGQNPTPVHGAQARPRLHVRLAIRHPDASAVAPAPGPCLAYAQTEVGKELVARIDTAIDLDHQVGDRVAQGGFVLRPFASPARELPEIVDFFPVS